MTSILIVGLGIVLVMEVDLMYRLISKEFKLKTQTENEKLIKVKCISSMGFEHCIIEEREYYILDEKENEDGSKSYKVLDEFYEEIWVDENRFEKVDE
jgi:hypothetical protein